MLNRFGDELGLGAQPAVTQYNPFFFPGSLMNFVAYSQAHRSRPDRARIPLRIHDRLALDHISSFSALNISSSPPCQNAICPNHPSPAHRQSFFPTSN
jgi:hypothetical protein